MIVPGGGLSRDGTRWISARPAFLLPVRVLGALFRRLFLTRLRALHDDGKLAFFGSLTHLAERRAFLRHLSPVRKKRWRSEEHTSELQSLMRISYAVFCLKKKKNVIIRKHHTSDE